MSSSLATDVFWNKVYTAGGHYFVTTNVFMIVWVKSLTLYYSYANLNYSKEWLNKKTTIFFIVSVYFTYKAYQYCSSLLPIYVIVHCHILCVIIIEPYEGPQRIKTVVLQTVHTVSIYQACLEQLKNSDYHPYACIQLSRGLNKLKNNT